MSSIVLLVGPSGVGKDAVLSEMARVSKIAKRVACTTRSPRPGEVAGTDYHFISREDFLVGICKDEFVEWAEVHGNIYGTSVRELEKAVATGLTVMFDIDVQGARQIKRKMPEVITIFILPPSMEELARRLNGRGSDADAVKARRLAHAREEIKEAYTFDYLVLNDEVLKAVDTIQKLLGILALGGTPPPERFRNTHLIQRLLVW